MPVSCLARNRELTATITGEVDHHGAKAIMGELDRQISAVMPRRLTLDCSGVTFMDSSGIAIMLRAWRRMGELGGRLEITGLAEQPTRVLRTAGVDKLIPLQ